ncbi:MAG: pyruvate kinase [Candidatus Kerfeldbacteria bacterium]|nr:pyruvate kinase [Candidatus Kerfeldbacteria bacterium]
MKRTKIVCTIGPSSHTLTTLQKMIQAGMNVARLNFSHGSYADHAELIALIRKAAKRCKAHVAILQDLQGPRIRIGTVPQEGITLSRGEEIVLVQEGVKKNASKKQVIPVQVALHEGVKNGTHILIQDGTIDIRVTGVRGKVVSGVVIQEGVVFTHKGINVPGVTLPVPALTKKDIQDAKFGATHNVDFVALSFVKDEKDIKKLRKYLSKNSVTKIIAKVERAEAIHNLDAIIEEADGVMVARGDLGVEMGVATVPTMQKKMIEHCIIAGKVVIVATQMLESMTQNSRPTRAEASDVANAVLDQADAVMLSAESASGKYPVKAVQTMARIIRATEHADSRRVHSVLSTHTWKTQDMIAHAAVELVQESKAKAIVVIGNNIDVLARVTRFRPRHVQIFFVTPSDVLRNQAQLYWGTQSVISKELRSEKSYVEQAVKIARTHGIKKGQRVVVIPAHIKTKNYTEELISI